MLFVSFAPRAWEPSAFLLLSLFPLISKSGGLHVSMCIVSVGYAFVSLFWCVPVFFFSMHCPVSCQLPASLPFVEQLRGMREPGAALQKFQHSPKFFLPCSRVINIPVQPHNFWFPVKFLFNSSQVILLSSSAQGLYSSVCKFARLEMSLIV